MLPISEFSRFMNICVNGLASPDLLTDWDREFLNSISTKLEKYKRHTFVSEKQEEQFYRIEVYLREELGNDYEE